MINKLSIVVPVFNEEKTISRSLERLLRVKFPVRTEVIVVNDGSTDGTGEILKKYKNIKYFEHRINSGKGSAVKTGISNATGDYIVIQDADLEYDPNDLVRMVAQVQAGLAEVVYGSRLTEPPKIFGKDRTPLLRHYVGNKFLSFLTSILYFSWLSDMETCYKLFPKKAFDGKLLNSKRFELEPEITAKLLKSGYKIKEISISTIPRGWEQGKKLDTVKDGLKALFTLFRYRFTD